MIDINALRHPRERDYFILSAICGGFFWFLGVLLTLGIILIYLGFVALALWIVEQLLKARLFGDAVKVSEAQYPRLNEIVEEQCRELGLTVKPAVFIANGQGVINAAAVRVLSRKYVILLSDLVDLLLERDLTGELAVIIGHELAHHAAGHLTPWRTVLLAPARLVPFLAYAYSRACELTCDRAGAALVKDRAVAQRALVAIALGSRRLAPEINIEAFAAQEREVPEFFGFLALIFSTHPRMTLRIEELGRFNP